MINNLFSMRCIGEGTVTRPLDTIENKDVIEPKIEIVAETQEDKPQEI